MCVTNTSYAGLSVTAYGKTFTQNNSANTISLNQRYPPKPVIGWKPHAELFYTPTSFYLGLADRDFWAMGLKSRWRPFYDACGLASRFAVTSGYEYSEISRTNVTYDLENLTPPVEFTQPDTNTNMFFVGLQQDWSREVNTYIRYRLIDNQWPMWGNAPEQLTWMRRSTQPARKRKPDRDRWILDSGHELPDERLVLDTEQLASFGVREFRPGQLPGRGQRLVRP